MRISPCSTPKTDMPDQVDDPRDRSHEGVLDRALPALPHDHQAHVVEHRGHVRPHQGADEQEQGQSVAAGRALTAPAWAASLAMKVMARVLTTP